MFLLSLSAIAAAIMEERMAPDLSPLKWALSQTALDLESPSYGNDSSLTAKSLRNAASEFLRMPPEDVPDYLLLATLLSGATRGDPITVSRRLLANGDLEDLSRREIFTATPGVGDVAHARVLAARELTRRAEIRAATSPSGQTITSPESAARLLRTVSRGPYERLSAIYLDNNAKVLGTRLLSQGTAEATIVDPRQVFFPAIQLGAKSMVIAHQHPSGSTAFSQQDIGVLNNLAESSRLLRIKMLDFLVVTPTAYQSAAEDGRISAVRSPNFLVN